MNIKLKEVLKREVKERKTILTTLRLKPSTARALKQLGNKLKFKSRSDLIDYLLKVEILSFPENNS